VATAESSSTGVEVDRAHVRVAVLAVQLAEAGRVARLLAEGAHDPHAGQRLLQVRRQTGDLLARDPVGAARGDPERDAGDRQHGEDRERDQRQAGIEHEQDRGRADQRQRSREERRDAIGHELVERLDIIGHARDQHTGLVA